MIRCLLLSLAIGCCPGLVSGSDPWEFSSGVPVTEGGQGAVFHHLDSSGRKNIAVSNGLVAVVWEDDRTGQPQVYLAFKRSDELAFSPSIGISTGKEAYEPTVVTVGDDHFLIAWEQDGRIHARTVISGRLGAVTKLSGPGAKQVVLTAWQNTAYGVWQEKKADYPRLFFTKIEIGKDGGLRLGQPSPVDTRPAQAPQLYPAIEAGPAGICVVWEDRRAGHTRLYYSHSSPDGRFVPPLELNEYFTNRNSYDRGSGVTRVSMAGFGQDEVVAAWMDKRRNGRGYGIYSALGTGGGSEFGPNERVQGEEGDEKPHSNPTTAGNTAGEFLVAWDDFRRGTSDIWMSWYNDDLEWSQDLSPSPAGGPGEQTNPSMVLDDQGWLHLAWVSRDKPGGPTRIWYARGRRGAN
ncbi:MAG: hypothetical protein GY703_13050 [Gammaproteobacteria bacterium]|nr:hypothetical protein [Gammaproteobacteria bacterium]